MIMARRLRIAHALLILGDELDFDGDCSFDEDDEGVMEFLLLRSCLQEFRERVSLSILSDFNKSETQAEIRRHFARDQLVKQSHS